MSSNSMRNRSYRTHELAEKYLQGISADVQKCRRYPEAREALITALAPVI